MTFSRFPQADLDALLDATPPPAETEQPEQREQQQMGDFETARGILPLGEGEEPPEVRLRDAMPDFEPCGACGDPFPAGTLRESPDGQYLCCAACYRTLALEATDDSQAERAYQESVRQCRSNPANSGVAWCHGYLYPDLSQRLDHGVGWGIWLATFVTDWAVGGAEQVDDFATFERCAGEAEARVEATRRNRGEEHTDAEDSQHEGNHRAIRRHE